MLRCRGHAARPDVFRVVPVGQALVVEEQPGRPVDPDRLYDTLSALVRKHQVPGAQLAIHHGGETVALEVGELEYGSGCRVTRDAAFPIGSVCKSFTATLVMILVADGDLELDAPVGEYLPELGDLGDQLTLRQVLSHTSGFASDPDSDEVSTATLRRYVLDHCHRENLVLPPGAGFSYSNMGYVLAGHLIETITGMGWSEAMESILLRPLRIDPAFVAVPGLEPPRRPIATGHSVNPVVGRTRPVDQSLAPAEAPAGALAMSAVDLVSLGLIHVGQGVPELLPVTYAEQMRQAVPAADPFGLADGWGSGLAVFRKGVTDWVGHDGNGDGTSCYLRVDPVGGWAVAFTSNSNTGVYLWQELLAELADTSIPIGRPRAWVAQGQPTAPPPDCVGTYVNGDVEYVVAERDGRLHLVDGDAFDRLTFYDGLTFSLQDPASGQQVLGGRFLRHPVTEEINGIQIGGRLACPRIDLANEAEQKLTA
ncbi:MAG: serine hydrolase domain-containing protein [Pseudonocardiaceae bacterium]